MNWSFYLLPSEGYCQGTGMPGQMLFCRVEFRTLKGLWLLSCATSGKSLNYLSSGYAELHQLKALR